jgi:hypothetical protein
MKLKPGDKVFIKHVDYVAGTVIGPRPGDAGTPEEGTRVMVMTTEEKRICLISELEVEKPRESPSSADWQEWTEAGQLWIARQDDKELSRRFAAASRNIGLLRSK